MGALATPGAVKADLRLFDAEAIAAEPLHTIVHHEPCDGGCMTCTTRIWERKESPTCGGLCTPEKCAVRFIAGTCQVVVPYFVPIDLCAGLADRPAR